MWVENLNYEVSLKTKVFSFFSNNKNDFFHFFWKSTQTKENGSLRTQPTRLGAY
jgi:hypothetical protein